MKRPVGVTILAVLAIIYGIFNLLLTLLGLIGIGLAASGVAAVASKYDVGTLAYAAIWDAVLGILYLVFGIGAFRLKSWAWTTGLVALVLELVRNIVGYFISGFGALSIITSVLALLLLWYLFRPNVRAAFGKAA
ncbi:MAG TPA: hypothetical protein VKY74_21885 [Chloroflexia bacterium]|nr:hypothetical protein [Chloroflexia bacterium]